MRYFKILLPCALLVLGGAGCLGLSGETTTDDGAVWKSQDAGLTWIQSQALPTANGVSTIGKVNIMDIVIDPQDEEAIYIGTYSNGLLFSYDSGVSWMQPQDSSLSDGAVQAIAIDPLDKCTIYAVQSTQVSKSEDCGRTFNTELYVESRSDVTVTDVEVDWYNPENVWIGTSEGDVIKSTDAGLNWITLYRAGDDISEILLDNNDSRIVYVATERKGVHKTIDGGENWTDLSDPMDEFSKGKRVVALTQSADSTVLIASTYHGLLRTTDGAETWTALELLTAPEEVEIPDVQIDPNDNNRIYYVTETTFHSTVDAGVNWQTRKLPTTRIPTVLTVDYTDGNVVYLGAVKTD